MGLGSSLLSSIGFLIPFQFLDNLVQLVEAGVPELAVSLDPCRFSRNFRAGLVARNDPKHEA
jgi:hypothetical protein